MCSVQVSSDVWRVHCVTGGEPVVLFQRGAVRLLDSLLSAPQQPIEEVLAQEEAIRSASLCLKAKVNLCVRIHGETEVCPRRYSLSAFYSCYKATSPNSGYKFTTEIQIFTDLIAWAGLQSNLWFLCCVDDFFFCLLLGGAPI